MGLSSKQVSNDHALDWGQTLLESGSVELPKPHPSRRQQQNQQQQPEPLKCPRCGSMNTKFCYYNNYNKSQPRHFCKACKRHWTKGGTLRNVPVGGGRKNKRLKISSTAANTTTPAAAANTATKNVAHIVAHGQQDCHNFPLATLSGQTKNMSDVLCRALMSNPSSISSEAINTLSRKNWMGNKNSFTSTVSPILSLPQDQSLPFSFSSLSPFGTIPCSFPSSDLSLGNSSYDYTGELDHVESTSTITTVTPSTSAVFSQSWQGPTTSSGMAEMPNYWNWNDVDPFASSDLNISWDEI